MHILKVRRNIDTMEVLRNDLLVRRSRLRRGQLALTRRIRFIDLDAVHEDRAFVLSAQTLKYWYDVFSFVSTHKLQDGSKR